MVLELPSLEMKHLQKDFLVKLITSRPLAKTFKSDVPAAKPGNEAIVKGPPHENHNYQILKSGVETPNLEIKYFQKEFLMKIITSRPLAKTFKSGPPKLNMKYFQKVSS